jgi:hypothetical protein
MHTDRITQLALDMAGLTEIPEDTQVYVPGEITRALVCIDADTGLPSIARDLAYDGVIVHHPRGTRHVRPCNRASLVWSAPTTCATGTTCPVSST